MRSATCTFTFIYVLDIEVMCTASPSNPVKMHNSVGIMYPHVFNVVSNMYYVIQLQKDLGLVVSVGGN